MVPFFPRKYTCDDIVLCIIQWGQKIKPPLDDKGKQIGGSLWNRALAKVKLMVWDNGSIAITWKMDLLLKELIDSKNDGTKYVDSQQKLWNHGK